MEFIKNLPSFIKDAYVGMSERARNISTLLVFTTILYVVSMPSTGVTDRFPVLGVIFTSFALLLGALLMMLTAHAFRKVFFNYDENMMQVLYDKAKETSTGAGLAMVAVSICFYAVALITATAIRV